MSILPDFALETYLSTWEFQAKYHLTASDAQSMPMAQLLAMADEDGLRRWESLTLAYPETRGLPALLEEIASTYETVSSSDVLCFAGAEEGIYLAMRTLLGPSDHMVVTTPNYQAAESVPSSICEVTGVALRAEDGWALDVEAIEAALRPNTRLVSVNFPNNPTGALPTPRAWRRLADLCDDRGIVLFSDEVYRGLEADPLPQAADLSENAISLNVMSKAYGLPGLRIGWIACRTASVVERLEHAKHYTSICNSAPSEVLALIALRAREAILARNRAIIAENLPVFTQFFDQHRDLFEFAPPAAGCVCYPRYLGPEGAEAMCAGLLRDTGVLLLPPSVYRSELTATPTDRFRISLGRQGPNEALAAWEQWLQAKG